MVETLRKKAKKSNMLRVIFSVIGVVILLAVTKFAIFDVLTGPTKLDITQDPATYEGKYVTIDAEYFLYDYIEHTTTTTRKYGGSTTTGTVILCSSLWTTTRKRRLSGIFTAFIWTRRERTRWPLRSTRRLSSGMTRRAR